MEQIYHFENRKRIFNLENKLSETLKPVFPNPNFVNNLKDKLAKSSTTALESSRHHYGLLMLGIGLSFGILLVWFFHREK